MQIIIVQFVHFQINYQLKCENNDLQCTVRAITSYVMSAVSIIKVCTFQLNTHAVRFIRLVDCD